MNFDPKTFNWSLLAGIVAAVCSFLLASDLHPQVILGPVTQLVLGAILVALAAAQGRK
jgi:peptidoglycan/LPS O-acetylase OafA/YrhL